MKIETFQAARDGVDHGAGAEHGFVAGLVKEVAGKASGEGKLTQQGVGLAARKRWRKHRPRRSTSSSRCQTWRCSSGVKSGPNRAALAWISARGSPKRSAQTGRSPATAQASPGGQQRAGADAEFGVEVTDQGGEAVGGEAVLGVDADFLPGAVAQFLRIDPAAAVGDGRGVRLDGKDEAFMAGFERSAGGKFQRRLATPRRARRGAFRERPRRRKNRIRLVLVNIETGIFSVQFPPYRHPTLDYDLKDGEEGRVTWKIHSNLLIVAIATMHNAITQPFHNF